MLTQGWDNKTFRLDDQMLVRMPSKAEYASKIIKEQKWLPKLSPLLPFAVPNPIAIGKPDQNFPYIWSIYNWIEGDSAASLHVFDIENIAIGLAQFITALNSIDTSDGPIAEPGSFSYIGGLGFYDDEMQQAVNILKDKMDTDIVKEISEEALKTTWQIAPVWVHGDISAGNILLRKEKLHAVIDSGGLSSGGPACDLVIA